MPAPDSYRLIVEGVRDVALYFIDPKGTVVTWNPGAERIHGFAAAEMIGQPHSVLFIEEDQLSGAPEIQLRAAERDGASADGRWLVRRDGSRFWSESSLAAMRDPQGRLAGFARITRDASDGRQLKQLLDRTNEELNRFAFSVSHDLQEPVRTMKSYGELLSLRYKGKLDADADEFINFMSEAANRMTQLLKDLLAYSQAGRPDRIRAEPTQAATILEWAIMNLSPLIKETGTVVTSGPLPSIHADQAQVAQLFQHVLTNSMIFRSEEPPRIHVSAAPHNDNLYRFSVRDNGVGVDKEFHERIFGVFKRLHGKNIPGTGMGLAICRKIVEAHGGQIWIDSDAGRGATIHFTLRGSE